MRLVLVCILLAFTVNLQAQIEKNTAALASSVGFASSGGSQFTGTLSNWSDVFSESYLPTNIQANDLLLDNAGREYRILLINSSNFSQANVTVEALDATAIAPTGRGVVWRPIGRGLIPPMPFNNGEITIQLRSLIDNHNANIVANIGGGQVDEISVLADTVSITDPAEGHILVKSDSTLAAFYDGTRWLVLTGGAGAGGGDDWGSQAVSTDGSTLDGDGTPGDVLGVNTSVIATRSWVETELDERIEVTVTQTGAVTGTITLPFQVDTRYPVHIYRGVAFNTSAFSGTAADWTISGTTATNNYRALEADEIVKIIYTKLQ